jgi:hypothetical protein
MLIRLMCQLLLVEDNVDQATLLVDLFYIMAINRQCTITERKLVAIIFYLDNATRKLHALFC